jgi:hypothetical protein
LFAQHAQCSDGATRDISYVGRCSDGSTGRRGADDGTGTDRTARADGSADGGPDARGDQANHESRRILRR